MTYKEDMKFQKHLSLWDWQSSGVRARNKFRRSIKGVCLYETVKVAVSLQKKQFWRH